MKNVSSVKITHPTSNVFGDVPDDPRVDHAVELGVRQEGHERTVVHELHDEAQRMETHSVQLQDVFVYQFALEYDTMRYVRLVTIEEYVHTCEARLLL